MDFLCRRALVEYLALASGVPRGALYRLVFPKRSGQAVLARQAGAEPRLTRDRCEKLARLLGRVRVLDPACGTGALLGGMLAVLAEVQLELGRRLGRAPREADLMRRLATGSLYGVDVSAKALAEARRNLRRLAAPGKTRPGRGTRLELNLRLGDAVAAPLAGQGGRGGFSWTAAFPRVFRRGGFDIVIGNPPYVRQERIADPLARGAGGLSGRRCYKMHLRRVVERDWDGQCALDLRSDLYAYFFARGLKLLREGGVLCFVTANAWLDVGYGAGLRRFLARRARIAALYDSELTRSFAAAQVNTVVSVLSRPRAQQAAGLSRGRARFVMLKQPYSVVAGAALLTAADGAQRRRVLRGRLGGKVVELARVLPAVQAELEGGGLGGAQPATAGGRWGARYLRAPEVYRRLLKDAAGALVPLGEVAQVRRGFTTGANDFFYLRLARPPLQEEVPGCRFVRSSLGWAGWIEERFLGLVVRSPRECDSVVLDPAALPHRLLSCGAPRRELAGSRVSAYIRWGSRQVSAGHQGKQEAGVPLPQLSSRAGREPWYALQPRQPVQLLCNRFFGGRLFFSYAPTPVIEDQTLYGARFGDEVDAPLQAALLNCTLQALLLSLAGRVALGEGVLQFAVYEMRQLLCLRAAAFSGKALRRRIGRAFAQMGRRRMGGILDELGLRGAGRELNANTPDALRLENVRPDRRELDAAVCGALGLGAAEQLALYRAVAELTAARLLKARSV